MLLKLSQQGKTLFLESDEECVIKCPCLTPIVSYAQLMQLLCILEERVSMRNCVLYPTAQELTKSLFLRPSLHV